MAALATKLGPISLPGLAALSGSSKLLGLSSFNNRIPAANIYSKTSGMLEPRLKPWPYETIGFSFKQSLIDGTTKRFNDNSKVIVVEGPPGLGKSKFAKELADELDMLYVPGASMEDYYINSYGYDLRELDSLFHYKKCVSYDEKKFAVDPLGQDGGLDRMQYYLMYIRFDKYIKALAHLFNTGQGIVTEQSPFSEHVFSEAAYKFGWLDRNSRIFFNKIHAQTLQELLRPNLIIYLDAPVDVVQAKIRERSKTTHPWEKNSPVFENSEYLRMVYDDMMKKQYMKNASVSSRVLMYDWSEGGDTEVVVEDIERLNMDYFDKYDKQQQDWRMHKEDYYAKSRCIYTDPMKMMYHFRVDYWDHTRILFESEEMVDFLFNAHKVPGSRYSKGYNPEMGESPPLFDIGAGQAQRYDVYYALDKLHVMTNEFDAYVKIREAKKARGEEKWWQF